MAPVSPLPTPEAFVLEAAPYAGFKADESNWAEVLRIEFYAGTLDTYCLQCGKESVFCANAVMPMKGALTSPRPIPNVEELIRMDGEEAIFFIGGSYSRQDPRWYAVSSHLFHVQFLCTRNEQHRLEFLARVNDGVLMKVGQYPSLADLQTSHIKVYRKILGEEQTREFVKAVGLFAHGVGIGSFVYLRRIFEALIDEAHTEARKAAEWDEGEYQRSRMDERIILLQHRLPGYLVENRAIYGILSKGLHELSEEECLEIFEPVKVGIELILDEKLVQEEKARKIDSTKKTIAEIKSRLSAAQPRAS